MRINYVFGLLDSFQDKETLHLPLWFWRLPPITSIIHQYMYYSSYPGSFFFGTCSLAKSQIQSCGWKKGLYQVKGANNTFFTNYQIKVAFYTVYYIARRLALQRMIQETGRVKFRSPQKQCLLKSVCDLMASWNLDWSDWSHFIFSLFFYLFVYFFNFFKNAFIYISAVLLWNSKNVSWTMNIHLSISMGGGPNFHFRVNCSFKLRLPGNIASHFEKQFKV